MELDLYEDRRTMRGMFGGSHPTRPNLKSLSTLQAMCRIFSGKKS